MTVQEYKAMPIKDRLNYAERAITLMLQEFTKGLEAAAADSKKLRADAARQWKAGNITQALSSDAAATGAKRCEMEMRAILTRIHCWQDSDTPPSELPFKSCPRPPKKKP